MTWAISCFLIELSLGSDGTGVEALFHHDTIIIEPEESPHTDAVTSDKLHGRHVREEIVPDEWLEESFNGGLDEFEHCNF